MARSVREIMSDINSQVARKRFEESQLIQEQVRQRREAAIQLGRRPRGRPRIHQERAPVAGVVTAETRKAAAARAYCPLRLKGDGAPVRHTWDGGVCQCGAKQCQKITGHGSMCLIALPCPYHPHET